MDVRGRRLSSARLARPTPRERPPRRGLSNFHRCKLFAERSYGTAGGGLIAPPRPSLVERLFQAVDDQNALVARHALVGLAEGRAEIVAGHAAEAGRDGDELLAARRVADDAALMADAVAVVPELRAGLSVIGVQGPAAVGHEHEIAPRRQDARHRRLGEADFPLLGAGDRVARVEVAVDLAARRLGDLEVGADVQLNLRLDHRRRLHDLKRHAPFLADLVVEAGLRVVGTRIPADAAGNMRAQHAVLLAGGEVAAPDQFAGLGVDAFDEVVVLRRSARRSPSSRRRGRRQR